MAPKQSKLPIGRLEDESPISPNGASGREAFLLCHCFVSPSFIGQYIVSAVLLEVTKKT